MAMKYDECHELYTHTLNTLTNSKANFTAFLESVGNNYKYKFEEQILIFAQYPKAKACASFDFWSKHGSRINRNSEGIALLDESARPYKKLKYVFDVSQTTALYPEAMPKRWEITDRHEAGIIEHLSNITGVLHDNMADTVVDFVRTEVENSYISFLPEVLSEKDNTLLSDLDDVAAKKVFRELLTDSVTCNCSKVITKRLKKMPPYSCYPAKNVRRKNREFHRRMKSFRLPYLSCSAAPGL